MRSPRLCAARSVGGLTSAALLFIAATALMPGRVEAQCATCFDTSCADYIVGANGCMEGFYYHGGALVEWCFTFGGMCEWIMQLDFAEDGTAYAARGQVLSTDEQMPLRPEEGETLSKTCDGVLLAGRLTKDGNTLPEAPIFLEL